MCVGCLSCPRIGIINNEDNDIDSSKKCNKIDKNATESTRVEMTTKIGR
jgi:hypothetical protein